MRLFLSFFVLILTCNHLFAAAGAAAIPAGQTPPPSKKAGPSLYDFSTQTQPSCPYSAAINWMILQYYKEGSVPPPMRFTKRQWLGVTYSMMLAIQHVEETIRTVPEYIKFIEDGPCGGEVYVKDNEKGTLASITAEGKDEDPLEHKGIHESAPFVTKNYESVFLTNLRPVLPIFEQGSQAYFIHDDGTEIPLKRSSEAGKADITDAGGLFHDLILTSQQKQMLGLQEGEKLSLDESTYCVFFGAHFPMTYRKNSEPEFKSDVAISTPYDYGSYLLMFFKVGLNPQGQEIDEKNTPAPMQTVARALQTAVERTPYHPWEYLTRDNFFEVQVTQLLAKNAPLVELMKKTIDIPGALKPWAWMCKSMDYHFEDGRNRRDYFQNVLGLGKLEDNLPLLAYAFSRQVNAVWAASISFKAWTTTMELEEIITKTDDPLEAMVSGVHRNLIMQSDGFLNLAQRVLGLLPKRDYITFYGHGNVLTFDPHFIERQRREHTEEDVLKKMHAVAKALGVAKIESCYLDALDPPYRTPAAGTLVRSAASAAAAVAAAGSASERNDFR